LHTKVRIKSIMKKTVSISVITLAAGLLYAAEAPKADSDAPSFTGKVIETMNAANYTYVCVDTGKGTNWAAAPQFAVKVGETVTITDGMLMVNYHSRSLNRDFPTIYFTGNASVAGAPTALPAGHPPIGGATSSPVLSETHPATKASAQPPIDFSHLKVPKGGKTVSEIVTGSANLNGKVVTVQGLVVKYNGDILGKNWLHIRDGSGKEGENDLTVTTSTEAKVGDTVLIHGKISLNRDFGSGYKYDVILDGAEVTVK